MEGSGIRVLDLERGHLRSIALEGAAARSLGWSPDSRWLVWSGQQPQNWTKSSIGGRNKSAGGRIAPNATVSEPIPVRNESNQSVSIGSSGEAIVFGQSGRLEAIAPNGMATVVTDLQGRSPTGTGVVSPRGTQVALGTFEQGSSASFLRPPRPGVVPEVTERELAKDLDLYPGGAAVQPLGWLDDQLVLVEVTPANNDDPSYGRRHLVVMTAPNVPEEDWTYRVMTRFADDAGQTSSVSVAVDLMTLEHPTADFPPPDWPWSDERKALVIGLSVAGLLGCLLLARRVRRRRRGVLR
ncbi:hypothetical protein D4739_07240 [Nocardioides cavernaquae]|uniref:WD40 repeat domain-containing protein n=1 Tax=Nocardioides cavernaquae TaxID=2321396 RepID=A0A3A5HDE9_9ACTN|nr:hypothetical protein D4739_07240 [Nocardioides cavernaquae]